jgi:iodotyrosine deiodinase
MTAPHKSIPLDFHELPVEQMFARATEFANETHRRRSVREFDSRPVPREIIKQCIRAACSAPSGANQQPWRFVAVSDPAIKKRIREAAEAEEREFYRRRASKEWLEALAPLGTDEHKPFLEIAPGMLIAALHHAGLATLTHTPIR